MGKEEITGKISQVEKFGENFIAIKVPIFYVSYHCANKNMCFGPALLRFTGEYKKPVYFTKGAIFSIEDLGEKEVLGLRYDEYLSLSESSQPEEDLPF